MKDKGTKEMTVYLVILKRNLFWCRKRVRKKMMISKVNLLNFNKERHLFKGVTIPNFLINQNNLGILVLLE